MDKFLGRPEGDPPAPQALAKRYVFEGVNYDSATALGAYLKKIQDSSRAAFWPKFLIVIVLEGPPGEEVEAVKLMCTFCNELLTYTNPSQTAKNHHSAYLYYWPVCDMHP